MPTPLSLLNRLRAVSAEYMLTDSVKIYRAETFTDEYGGTYNDYRLIETVKARIVHKQYQEEPQGGGITNRDEYYFYFGDAVDVTFDDKLIRVDDVDTGRYFLVVGVDSAISQGIFLTVKTEVNYN
jgi:head-tail adaptor